MGSGRWDSDSRATYSSFASASAHKTTDQIYSSRSIHEDLDPLRIKVRESRDSALNPHSTPIIVALDVTGSMGMLADNIARTGLGTLFTSILDRRPVTDPHLMFMGVGDATCDRAPLQVSQFEADKRIIEQLTKLYLEHGGGGNDFESYNLPWYFAAFHTVHDAMEKRGQKGFLFTVGDEEAPHPLSAAQIKRFIGDDVQREISTKEMLELAQRVYNVYHVVVEEGNHCRSHRSEVFASWNSLLGQHVIPLADHTKLAEVIVSAIEVAAGNEATDVSARWKDDATRGVVHQAVKNLPKHGGPIARTA